MEIPLSEIHPDAKRNFDTRGELLAKSVVRFRENERPKPTFTPNIHIASTVTEADIVGDIELRWQDKTGRAVGRALVQPDGLRVGLLGNGYQQMTSLAAAMRRAVPFREVASIEFLENESFGWALQRVKGQPSESLTDWMIGRLRAAVAVQCVVVPLSGVHVQSELTFGDMKLREFPESFLNQLDTGVTAEEAVKWRNRCQGKAAVFLSVAAEPEYAKQIALDRAEDLVSALRLFSMCHAAQQLTSGPALSGLTPIRTRAVFSGADFGRFQSISDRRVDQPVPLMLDDDTTAFLRDFGLPELQVLVGKIDRNEFETAVMTAVALFGRAALSWDLRERLVWYCAGLESLLLKNDSEPITQNLSDRLALFAYTSVEDRTRAQSNIRAAYKLRSRFVHHGNDVGEITAVEDFAGNGFVFFVKVLKSAHRFNDKSAFINHIDTIKLSGMSTHSS